MSTIDDLFDEVRVLSMASVEGEGAEYTLRKICRWYSRSFSTPLHVVEADIPLETVLRHFFESVYETLEDVEREEEVQKLMLTPAERKQQQDVEEAADDDFLEQTIAEAETKKKADPAQVSLNKPLTADEREDRQLPLIPVMGTSSPLNEARLDNQPLKEIPPDIKIEFVDDLGDLDDWDITGPPDPEDR